MDKTYAYLICPQNEKHLLQEFTAALDAVGIEAVYEETHCDNSDYRKNNIDISAVAITCTDNWTMHDACVDDLRYCFRKDIDVIVGETADTIGSILKSKQYAH